MKTKYTFWELLSDFTIEIPKIQRDYAQGRKDPEIKKIVDKFLNDLKNSIVNNEELNLDFVYGRVENNILTPLDGQQRLTTLFLIHWYVALKENKLTEDIKKILSKFTYETRVSSEDFCKNLVSKNINYSSIGSDISYTITDSKWYFLSWKLDPTVSAMLNMLDAIHEKFHDIREPLFDKLQQNNNITFQFLPLEKFKLADELYIKMNARGKPLTEFENFKASFSQYLSSIEQKSKLDNEWLDIFWNLEKNSRPEKISENVDSKIFNFFKNITLNFHTEKTGVDREFINTYNLFDAYSHVYNDKKYVNEIIKVFDGLINFDDKDNIFINFIKPSINYWERLRFYAVCQFFITHDQVNDDNKTIFNNWLRITNNLINNTRIEGANEFESAIKSINELSANIFNIYEFISSTSDNISYFYKPQRDEESLKASLIQDDPSWEKLFIRAERHPYLDGQIGFILNYSINSEGKYNQSLFNDYSSKIQKLFGSEFCENHEFLFQRALLTKGNYLVNYGPNKTFCTFDSGLRKKFDNWRKVFNGKNESTILKKLLDDIGTEDIYSDLSNMIRKNKKKGWVKLLIENSDYIAYCQYRQIRISDNIIYLLSKGQMNGRHKEIFSWDLFKRKFNKKEFLPFSNKTWYWNSTSWYAPCIVLYGFSYKRKSFAIDIQYSKNNKYMLYFYDAADDENNFLPDNIKKLLDKLKFKGDNTILLSEDEIEGKLVNICKKLIKL